MRTDGATSSTSTGGSSTTPWPRCWSTTTWRSPRPGRSPGSTIRSGSDGSTGRRRRRRPCVDLLDLDPDDAAAVAARWRRPGRRAATPLGVGPAGPVVVDLVADGPHGLVAGTTGSGKSELLRSLVAGLAATLPPDELNLVLVDFKGGAAFDACADLPHTVGLVTDLDEHLAGRVLRCLRAELTHRERVLRAAGASALDELGGPGAAPLPRLLLVIDEFASLSAQLPEFVPGLVEIAQRGRSLGFHLVLATQRPAGVVDQRIKANTDLRIALRVQDEADSVDVVGVRDAAAIPRTRPGRALARFAAGELVELQTALASGAGGRRSAAPLTVRPFVHHRTPTGLERRVADRADAAHGADGRTEAEAGPSDLRRIVGAIAAAATDRPAPRRPYLDPLPEHVTAADLGAAERAGDVPFALVDRPDEQRRTVRGWRPGTSLAVYGVAGSGTTSLLATLALGLAGATSADDAHVYVVDADAGALGPLAALAHVGAVVRVDERDRLARLAALLARELDRRRRVGAAALVGEPSITLLVDNVGSLRQALDQDRDLAEVWPALERVLRDGPALGVGAVVTAHQERALPPTAAAQIAERLVMRLADRHAYAAFGFRSGDVPAMVPGRALCTRERLELQVVAPAPRPRRRRGRGRRAGAPAAAGARGRAARRRAGERARRPRPALDRRLGRPARARPARRRRRRPAVAPRRHRRGDGAGPQRSLQRALRHGRRGRRRRPRRRDLRRRSAPGTSGPARDRPGIRGRRRRLGRPDRRRDRATARARRRRRRARRSELRAPRRRPRQRDHVRRRRDVRGPALDRPLEPPAPAHPHRRAPGPDRRRRRPPAGRGTGRAVGGSRRGTATSSSTASPCPVRCAVPDPAAGVAA